jgi:hypothetical protein
MPELENRISEVGNCFGRFISSSAHYRNNYNSTENYKTLLRQIKENLIIEIMCTGIIKVHKINI